MSPPGFRVRRQKPGTARNQDTLELGQRIWRAGIADKALPACSGCHNPTGAGIPNQYPRLGGQHAEYVEATLKAFRDGTRHNNVPMQQIAARMTRGRNARSGRLHPGPAPLSDGHRGDPPVRTCRRPR